MGRPPPEEKPLMPHREPVARRMFELTEPISLVNFFSWEPTDSMAELGFPRYSDGYFAGGAAPLGRVPAEVVDAAFYSYADGEVARHIAQVWETTTPEAAHAARQRGCVAALRRILGDLVVTPELARAAELLAQASTTAATEVNLSRRARCAVRVGRPAPAFDRRRVRVSTRSRSKSHAGLSQ
jgi:hypothetical protein